MSFILSVDQSTSGTKAMLLDESGRLIGREDLPHEQKIDDRGRISHDPEEIYLRTLGAVEKLLHSTGTDGGDIVAVGISNQRETSLIWDRDSGEPVADAVVWQCDRASGICERLSDRADMVREKTGLTLSPYFPASKWAWLLENTPNLDGRRLCAGTIDSWLIYKLTGGFFTDFSNASRTQLFNLKTLDWDDELCALFGIGRKMLPEVRMSDGDFGSTDFGGLLPRAVPIRGVMGDSHAALFGQGCLSPGMAKVTYGTGSSVMMNVGDSAPTAGDGVVASVAWGMGGRVSFVLEGNINYTGSVIKWVADDLGLIGSPSDAGAVAASANPDDTTYLVPAFSGLGAPYWRADVRAMFCGMGRGTGRAELVKAAEESIAYQITDVVRAMEHRSGSALHELYADGGPTRDSYLMQFQSDILGIPIAVSERAELSGIGAAYCAGIACGLYDRDIFSHVGRAVYSPQKDDAWREKHHGGWRGAVEHLL